MENLFVSVIIPCFNEEAVIRQSYQRVKQVLNSFPAHEMIFVNDGSSDGSFQILRAIANADMQVKVIDFSRNFGHQPAVTAGIHACSGDVAVIIDADMQDPPELIPAMIAVYREQKCNVVYGVRKQRAGETFFKKITARYFYKLLSSLSETPIPLDAGDFRLIDRQVIAEFRRLTETHKFVRGLISWIGFRQAPFYYNREERAAGSTKYPVRRMMRFGITGIMYFSKRPLQIAVVMGLACTVISLLLLVYAVYSYFYSNRLVSGWASTVIIIIFFSGIQLLSLGLVAQYIAGIFDEVKNRPEYIVAEKINF
jgi:dolichol-phosphate mannosyltransferase